MEFEFFVTNTPESWQSWKGDEWDVDVSGVMLKKVPNYVTGELIFSQEDEVLGAVEFIDMVLDDCDCLYVLDSNGEVHRYYPNQKTLEKLLFTSKKDKTGRPLQFTNPRGLWITKDSIYIVDEGRLHCISKHVLQTRWIIGGQFKEHLELVVDKKDNVYVLDKDAKTILKVSKDGRISGPVIKGLDGTLDIAMDASQNIYILEKFQKGKAKKASYSIIKFEPDYDVPVSFELVTKEIGGLSPTCISTSKGGELFIGGTSKAGGVKPKESLLSYLPREESFPETIIYKGDSHKLLLDSRNNLYVITGDKKTVQFYKNLIKNKFKAASRNRRFDSGKNGAEWHRVKLEYDSLDSGMQIQVFYFATDKDEGPLNWSPPLINPKDALLEEKYNKGRYLHVRINLIGTEYDSPRVKSLRAYFPRMSYLRYLPAIYQEDASSKAFLEGFLSLFESFFADVEEGIDGITSYFDPFGIPAEYLSWLGSWMAIEADETWPESKMRKLIAVAPQLYKMRGTKEGLLKILRLYLSERELGGVLWDVGILEYFQLECIDNEELKIVYKRLFGGCPQCFTVLVNSIMLREEERNTLRRIIDAEKPAHTVGQLVELRPQIHLDEHSYLGINTILLKPKLVLQKSKLGKDAVVTEQEDYGVMELKSRIGIDTVLSQGGEVR